jgi:hypothetical protein
MYNLLRLCVRVDAQVRESPRVNDLKQGSFQDAFSGGLALNVPIRGLESVVLGSSAF